MTAFSAVFGPGSDGMLQLKPSGSTRLKRLLLTNLGWKVDALPYYEWDC